MFVAPAAGMGALVDALARRLPEGVLRLRAPVVGLGRADGRWNLRAGGESLAADGVVLAAPAHAAAPLCEPLDAALGRELRAIEYASSATVTLAYHAADAPGLRGFGFVVPAVEHRAVIACTWAARKFPGRAPDGMELARGFVGGALRPDLVELDDAAIADAVRSDLRDLAGITAAPALVRVHRHRRAMPQYGVGHLDRVATIEARAAALPAFALAGAAYRGVGIPDCVPGGEAAADAVLSAITTATG
jgi:oxygen-dependent protoporphyrinogen oxidase